MKTLFYSFLLALVICTGTACARDQSLAATPVATPSSSPQDGSSIARGTKCEDLVKLTMPDVTVTSAADIPAGPFTPPGLSTVLETPDFCRVVAVARPTPDSVINFEVWIPPAEQWNHNFLGVGNGGYTGAISYAALSNALRRGFAAASTDTGHTGGEDLDFGVGHPEKIVDWGYRSVHVMTESAKLIVRDYEGRFAKHAYFFGCSTGGEQALSEAQRFPADYDGVIAGDPGNDRVHINVGFLWAFAATHDLNGNAILPTSKLPLISKAAVAACDLVDGVKDGIISSPQACHFDPGTLLCNASENDQCLTSAQVEAVRKIYAGPRNPRSGEQIIAGYSPGSESPAGDLSGGWKTYITDRSEPMRLGFWQRWVFNDPNWDWHTFDYDHDVAYADDKMAATNASNPDLRAFKARGGKILMYSGWADPIGPSMDAVNYYEKVQKLVGGRQKTGSFFRLFMAPGMSHCGGGSGPNLFGNMFLFGVDIPRTEIDTDRDVLSALQQWVEKDSAPQHIIAAHRTDDVIDRTRPLCPYPKVARWNAKGDSDDAKNFACVEARANSTNRR